MATIFIFNQREYAWKLKSDALICLTLIYASLEQWI